jgi:hypothetical protein
MIKAQSVQPVVLAIRGRGMAEIFPKLPSTGVWRELKTDSTQCRSIAGKVTGGSCDVEEIISSFGFSVTWEPTTGFWTAKASFAKDGNHNLSSFKLIWGESNLTLEPFHRTALGEFITVGPDDETMSSVPTGPDQEFRLTSPLRITNVITDPLRGFDLRYTDSGAWFEVTAFLDPEIYRLFFQCGLNCQTTERCLHSEGFDISSWAIKGLK